MKKVHLLAIALSLGVLASCQKDSETSTEQTLSGSAVKGNLNTAQVKVYQYSNGQRGLLVASTTTDAKGSFSMSTDHQGAVEIVVSQGSYLDEATGTQVSLQANELRSIVSLNKSNRNAAVTALTTIAAGYVDVHAAAGIETAISNANLKVADAFGLKGIDISTVIPADLSLPASAATTAQIQYGAIQAGLSQSVKQENLSADKLLTLIKDFSKDMSDGVIDGKSGTVAVQFALTITPSQAAAGLNTAITNFLNSSNNKSGYAAGSVSITVPRP